LAIPCYSMFLQNEMKNNANSWNNKNFVKFEHWFNAENQMNNISAKNVLYVLCLSQHILLLKYSLLIDFMFLRTNASINHKVNVKVRFKVYVWFFFGATLPAFCKWVALREYARSPMWLTSIIAFVARHLYLYCTWYIKYLS